VLGRKWNLCPSYTTTPYGQTWTTLAAFKGRLSKNVAKKLGQHFLIGCTVLALKNVVNLFE